MLSRSYVDRRLVVRSEDTRRAHHWSRRGSPATRAEEYVTAIVHSGSACLTLVYLSMIPSSLTPGLACSSACVWPGRDNRHRPNLGGELLVARGPRQPPRAPRIFLARLAGIERFIRARVGPYDVIYAAPTQPGCASTPPTPAGPPAPTRRSRSARPSPPPAAARSAPGCAWRHAVAGDPAAETAVPVATCAR